MSDTLKKLREPAALAAVAYGGLVLLSAVINLLVPPSDGGVTQSFASRAFEQAPMFLNFSLALAIGIAVYLANEVEPPLARAKVVTLAALIEGGVAALFGVVTALALFGADGPPGQTKLAQFFIALGGAAVVAVAAWYAWLSWQRHAVPKAQPTTPGAGGAWPGSGYPQQPSPPPGGFGWTPQQQPPYGAQPPGAGMPGPSQPQQQPGSPTPFGSDRTQLLPPVQQGGAQPGQGMQGAQTQAQPVVPPTMQGYAPQPQPWSPGVTGQQQVPQQSQQPQPQPQSEQDQRPGGGFPIGEWRSE
jgi:hypothetical protein